ncbi:MAG: DMT family transporter [Bacteroidetes bacterium]|jgi:drug/metabolite transporter (DMT)-like permease|nr:DMT family transporter [Bacteroidota bacterium]
MNDRKDRQAELLVVVVMTIWAANAPFAKLGLERLDVFLFNSLRYIVAFGALMVLLRSRTEWIPVQSADRWPLLRLGIVASIIYQLVYILGLRYTTAGNSAVLLSTSPLWTAVISARMHRERLSWPVLAGMALALAGIVVIVTGSGTRIEFGGDAVVGDLLSLAAAFLWALNTNLQKPLLARYPALQLTVISLGIGAVGLTLVATPSGFQQDWATLDLTGVWIAVISGALSIGIANVLWSYGVKRLGPRRTAGYNNLVPVMTFAISYAVFGAPVFLQQIIGAAMTVTGVWWARRQA